MNPSKEPPPMLNRRLLLAAPALAVLPRPSLGQADQRPAITIAVQKVVNSNTLETLREQSNVGERVFYSSLWEGLIGRDWLGQLGPVPGLATEWRRISDSVVELSLRRGVMFHNGEEMTAEDVIFSFGRDRMFGTTLASAQGRTIPIGEGMPAPRPGRELPPEVPAVARRSWPALERVEAVDRYTVRFVNATPDVTLEGRLSRYGSDIVSRRAFEATASWLEWARKPVTTGPYKVGNSARTCRSRWWRTTNTGAVAHRCARFASSKWPRCRRASTGCCRANTSSPATSRPTRSPASSATAPSRCRAAPSSITG